MSGQEGGHFPATVLPIAGEQVPAPLHADQPGTGDAARNIPGRIIRDEGIIHSLRYDLSGLVGADTTPSLQNVGCAPRKEPPYCAGAVIR